MSSGTNQLLRRASAVVLAIVTLVGASVTTRVAAWTTDDPTRAVVYQGIDGVDSGVMGFGRRTVAVDSSGNIYVLSLTGGRLAIGPGPNSQTVGDVTLAAYGTFVLTKSDTSGDLAWQVNWRADSMTLQGLTVNSAGIFVGGRVTGTQDLDPTSGTDTYAATGEDGIVMQMRTDGSYVGHLAIPVQAGSGRLVDMMDVVSSKDNNVIITGSVSGNTTFPGGSTLMASSADRQGFAAQLNTTSGQTDWLVTLTGSASEHVYRSVVVDDGSVFLMGVSSSGSVVLSGSDGATTTMTTSSSLDAVIARVSAAGVVVHSETRGAHAVSMYQSSKDSVLVQYQGGELRRHDSTGASTVVGNFVFAFYDGELTSDGKVRLVGFINGAADFDIGSGVDTRTPAPTTSSEGFLLTLDSDLRTESVRMFKGPIDVSVNSVASAPDGGFVIVGAATAGTIDISNTIHPGVVGTTAGYSWMQFIVRYDAAGSTGASVTAAPASASYVTGNKKATFQWSAVTGAVSYAVVDSTGANRCTSTTTSCEVTGLRNGKLYTWVVRSLNAAGVASTESRSVRFIPGFRLRTTTYKVRRTPLLTSIVSTPSKGAKQWRVTSGACRISGSRLVMPTRKGTCRLKLTVAKRGSYPAMSTTVKVTVTR